MSDDAQIQKALDIACLYSQLGGEDHKAWTIDQMVRALLGDDYYRWVADAKGGDDGPETYGWNVGVEPESGTGVVVASGKKCSQHDARTRQALDIACAYSQVDGAHHKAWAIDQMVRALLGDDYDGWVAEVKAGDDGAETYGWDVGIAP